MKTKLKITLKKNYIPIDYFGRFFVGNNVTHTIANMHYDKGDYWDITIDDKDVEETLELLNKSVHQSRRFFELFGKDAFHIEIYGYKDFYSSSYLTKHILKLNDIKYNLGNIEFIRHEEEN